jgi:hypothetical protein
MFIIDDQIKLKLAIAFNREKLVNTSINLFKDDRNYFKKRFPDGFTSEIRKWIAVYPILKKEHPELLKKLMNPTKS